MGALDEPDRYTFLRGGRDPRRDVAEARVAWFDTLTGAALEAKKNEDGLTEAQKRLDEYRRKAAQAPPAMKPGMTRGGKVIDAGH